MVTQSLNELTIQISTDDPHSVLAAIYGMAWHKVTEGINDGKTLEELKPEYDIINAIDSSCLDIDRVSRNKVKII